MKKSSALMIWGCMVLAAAAGCGGGEPDDLLEQPAGHGSGAQNIHETISEELALAVEDFARPAPLAARSGSFALSPGNAPTARLLNIRPGGDLRVPASSSLDKALKDNFTVEFWMRPGTDQDQDIVRAKGLSIGIRDKRLTANLDGVEIPAEQVVADEWYHVALMVLKDQAYLLVNGGISPWSTVPLGPERPSGELIFGGDGLYPGFTGKLDLVRLADEAIHKTGGFLISQALVADSSEVLVYTFEGCDGPTAVDMSGLQNDGQIFGQAEIMAGSI